MTTPLPAAAGIGRVALRVADLDEMVAFYRDVVGLTGRSRDGDAATLGTVETPLVELAEDSDAPARPESAAGLFHTAVRVPSRAALGDALERVREEWRLSGASDHAVSEALYLRDPEGNGVEIYCDRPRADWPTTDDGRVEIVTAPLDLESLANAASGGSGGGGAGSGGGAGGGDAGSGGAGGGDAGSGGAGGGTGSVPAGTDIGHVHLEVTSLDAAGSFYADALGLGVRQEIRGALFLAAGDYHHHLGANVWNGRSTSADGRGLDWFELAVPDAEALAAVRKRLEAAGMDPTGVDERGHGGDGESTGSESPAADGPSLAVTDPDGIAVRVVVAE